MASKDGYKEPKRFGSRQTEPKERRIEIACKQWDEKALKVLTDAILDSTIDIRWRLQAAKEVLDRAYGRPRQQMDATVKVEAAEALLAALTGTKVEDPKE